MVNSIAGARLTPAQQYAPVRRSKRVRIRLVEPRTRSDGAYDFGLVIGPAPRVRWPRMVTRDLTIGQHDVDTLTRFGKRFAPCWTHYSETSEPQDREIGSPWRNSKEPRAVVAFSFNPISTVVCRLSHLGASLPALRG